MNSSALQTSTEQESIDQSKTSLLTLSLGALGIVYGDIGTSPLYALKEVFSPSTAVQLTPDNVIGAVSVVLWGLMLVVTLKYVVLILRADNKGEGGILALTALASSAVRSSPRLRRILILLGLFGATLFYGDSVITPAISVLGALEGLVVVTPTLGSYVIPATVVIMLGLFAIQRHGTGFVGKAFGPVLLVWFATLAMIGIWHIVREPSVLHALNPLRAIEFLSSRGWHLLAAVGAIALVLTGAEALYADMGHFGKRPIQLAWNAIVLPSLALNYMGQGALLIAEPAAIDNPFYRMFPESMMLSIVVLAMFATIIASQAVISGAYSMTKQAMQLGLLPRMTVLYTSAKEIGQIYIPVVNWVLFFGVIIAVIGFGSSSALAGAYGIAVTLTMLITTVLTYFVIRYAWQMSLIVAVPATAIFFCADILLVSGCSQKIFEGGWFPLALGVFLFIVMETWERGRVLVANTLSTDGIPLESFINNLSVDEQKIANRTAIYAVGNADIVPQALLHNLKHNQVIHQRNIILTVVFRDIPWVPEKDRVEIYPLNPFFWKIKINFGFMNSPDVPKALQLCEKQGLIFSDIDTTYFLSRQTVIPTHDGAMSWWRENLFSTLHRNAGSVADFFKLPDNSIVELGTHIQI
jgi:KUP system potassium uptake protein